MSATSVAVVVTAWNREQFVERAVRSAFDQLSTPEEVVVVKTAGPTDESLRAMGARLVLVADTTTIGDMWKKAIETSSQDIICFLDDDDAFHRDKVRFVRSNFDVVPELPGIRNELCVRGARALPTRWNPVDIPVLVDPDARDVRRSWRHVAGRSLFNASTYSIRRSAFEPHLSVLPKLEASPDTFLLLMALDAGPMYFTPRILNDYYVETNTSFDETGRRPAMQLRREIRSMRAVLPHLGRNPFVKRLADDFLYALEADAAAARHRSMTWYEFGRLLGGTLTHPTPHRLLFLSRAIGRSLASEGDLT